MASWRIGVIAIQMGSEYEELTYVDIDTFLGTNIKDVHDNKLPNYPLRFRLDLVVID